MKGEHSAPFDKSKVGEKWTLLSEATVALHAQFSQNGAFEADERSLLLKALDTVKFDHLPLVANEKTEQLSMRTELDARKVIASLTLSNMAETGVSDEDMPAFRRLLPKLRGMFPDVVDHFLKDDDYERFRGKVFMSGWENR